MLSLALVLALSACGSSSSSSTAEATTTTEEGEVPAGGEGESEAEAGSSEYTVLPMEELYSGSPTQGVPPATGPLPAKSVNVWWVSCGLQAEPCAIPAEAAEEAAKEMGWSFHIADGKLNENGGDLAAVRTAIAAGPSAIILHGINCPLVKSALEEAQSQGILVMGVESNDCSDFGGPQLYTAEMKYGEQAESAVEYFKSWGNRAASYFINKTDETAELINQEGTEEGLQTLVSESFEETMNLCEGCKILETLKFQSADLAPNGPLATSFRTALVKNPEATAVFAPFGSNVTSGETVKSITAAGLTGDLVSCCGGGEPLVLEYVRKGEMTATIAHSAVYMGWAAMDNLNRALNEKETVPQGVELVMVDKEHGLPANPGEEFEPSKTWKAEYQSLWKTGKSK